MKAFLRFNRNPEAPPLVFRQNLPARVGFGLVLLVFFLGRSVEAGIRAFPIPTPTSQPISITFGPDGNFWFTEQNSSQVARITPGDVITEFRTPTFSFPQDITAGPDGNIWFTEGATGKIAFITPQGRITEVTFSSFDASSGIITGPDGNIWFTDVTGNNIWRLDLVTHELTMFPVPTPDAFPNDITTGEDGNLWFTESIGKIGRITPDGVITEFGDNLGLVFTITDGPDGNVWFSVRFTPEVGRITPAGDITFFRPRTIRSRSPAVMATRFLFPSSAQADSRESPPMESSPSHLTLALVSLPESPPGQIGGAFGFSDSQIIQCTPLRSHNRQRSAMDR